MPKHLNKWLLIALLVAGNSPAFAGGWDYVLRHPSVLGPVPKCGFGRATAASYYGPGFHGKRTYCKGVYDQHGLTFASNPRYACGTKLTFTNPRNRRSVTATATDYGPFGKARLAGVEFDLSVGTKNALGMTASQRLCVQ